MEAVASESSKEIKKDLVYHRLFFCDKPDTKKE